MIFDSGDLRRAWKRQGDAATERPDEVDEVMGDQEQVGFEEGLPLLDRDYQTYPKGDDLLRPSSRDALETLTQHKLIADVEDIAHELRSPIEIVEAALDLHGLPEPEGFDVAVDTDRLHALAVDVPDRMIDQDNPLLAATLYVECGLSVAEIREVIAEATDVNKTVTERAVKRTLVDARLIDGTTSDEADRRWKESRGEVNRTGSSRGMTISTEDY